MHTQLPPWTPEAPCEALKVGDGQRCTKVATFYDEKADPHHHVCARHARMLDEGKTLLFVEVLEDHPATQAWINKEATPAPTVPKEDTINNIQINTTPIEATEAKVEDAIKVETIEDPSTVTTGNVSIQEHVAALKARGLHKAAERFLNTVNATAKRRGTWTSRPSTPRAPSVPVGSSVEEQAAILRGKGLNKAADRLIATAQAKAIRDAKKG